MDPPSDVGSAKSATKLPRVRSRLAPPYHRRQRGRAFQCRSFGQARPYW